MGSMTPEQVQAWRWEKELDERNRPLSDDELDALFPLVWNSGHIDFVTEFYDLFILCVYE